jgi:hypothetical protein
MDGNLSSEPRKTSFKVFFDKRKRESPGNLNILRGLFPRQPALLSGDRLMEKDVFSRYSDFIQLTLDDLVDQKNFLRKIFLRKRYFSQKIGIRAEGEKTPEHEG